MKDIILASASPRRKDLLQQINISFEIIPSDVEEDIEALCGSPEEKAEQLALMKARDVAGRLNGGLVLGADTIVVFDGNIFGKPADDDDAFRMLSELGDKDHFVITGIAVIDAENGNCSVAHEKTKVTFSRLDEERIRAYIAMKEHCGKAGAYGIQGMGALLVEKIEGCYFNVVGLPLMKLSKMLEAFGMKVL